MTAERRTWTVGAADAATAVEAAKRLARNEGLRIRTIASCRPQFGAINRETGRPRLWDVALSVEAAA